MQKKKKKKKKKFPFWDNCIWKSCNKLSSLLNRGNLLKEFQMHLDQEQKIISQFCFTFSKFRFNFQHC